MIYTDDKYVSQTIKVRDPQAHKGDFGRILIFAGSTGMAGAAVLCGRAALRTGSGLVQFLLPALPCDIYPILQTAVPEATCVEYSSDFDFNKYDAIAAGSGIGQSRTSAEILKNILLKYGNFDSTHDANGSIAQIKGSQSPHDADDSFTQCRGDARSPQNANTTFAQYEKVRDTQSEHPGSIKTAKALLLDADALNLISKDPELAEAAKNSKATIIITPHVGEAKRLLNTCEGIKSFSSRKNAVFDLAEKYNCVAVLKGAGTLVAARSGINSLTPTNTETNIFENTTGNPGMATAGSGDVLSGIITSFAGQGYNPVTAARLGVFIHGKAGDIAAEDLGEMSVIAGDIVANIPKALKIYYNKQ